MEDFLIRDIRPRIGGWCPGWYFTECSDCKEQFLGAKRGWTCADCAYKHNQYNLNGETVIDLILDCPECGEQHHDKGEWRTKLHKKHLCEHCDHIWDPFEGSGHKMYSFGITWRQAFIKSEWRNNGHGSSF